MNGRPEPSIPAADAGAGFEKRILRLVRSDRDRRAVQAGQVDAIIDPISGRALLMPDAQAALLQRKALFRGLVELSTDGCWEVDENYCFTAHSGAAIGNADAGGASILGRTLWELAFHNGDEVDWRTLRTQLEWRANFRDLEFRCVDAAGWLRTISLSGAPMFDREDRFTGYRGVTRDLTDRRLANPMAPDSDRFARAALDALATRVCVLDAAGLVLTANTAWRQFAASHRGSAANTGEGSNYLDACGRPGRRANADDRAIAAGVRQVIAGVRTLFRYECPHETAAGAGWSLATVTRMRGENAARAIVSFEDISEIKRAESLLRLEYKVASTLATADPSAAVSAVIRAVCEAQHWDCGRYFRMDPAAGELSLDAAWGMPGPAITHFIEQSRGVAIRPGAGLAGRVYEAGEPLWIADEGKDPRAAQAALAHELGMVGTLAFPIVAAAGTLGVLMFSSHSVVAPDERLLQVARAIGQQLGQFLQRREAEAALPSGSVTPIA